MKYFSLIIILLSFYSQSFSQVEKKYKLSEFTIENLGQGIDSIWLEVASWDGDTSQATFQKREQYAADLENYYFRNIGNENLKTLAHKALLYSYAIRFKNKDTDKIINNFEKIHARLDPGLWGDIYPIYSRNVKGKYEDRTDWIKRIQAITQSNISPRSKIMVWFEIGQYYFYTENKEIAKKYFFKIVDQESTFPEDSLPKRLLKAKSFLDQIDKLQVGQMAPPFCATDIANNEFCLNEKPGKVFLLEFWATWCTPCREDIPMMKRIFEKYKERDDFQIVSISLDHTLEKLIKFLQKEHIIWPEIYEGGENERKGKITLLYNGMSLPTYYVIGKDRVIHYNFDSRHMEVNLEETLSALLDK